MRAPARRYLRTIGQLTPGATEAECVQELIAAHMRSGAPGGPPGWFGRLLWKLFSRWL